MPNALNGKTERKGLETQKTKKDKQDSDKTMRVIMTRERERENTKNKTRQDKQQDKIQNKIRRETRKPSVFGRNNPLDPSMSWK
jgi:hypothetical protein